MKKIFITTVMLLTLALALVVCAGCPQEAQISGIEYLSGLKTAYYLNEEANLSNVKIKVNYSDGTSETITVESSAISGFDTSINGEFTATITYEGFTASVSYTVRPVDYIIEAIEEPDFIRTYKNNIKEQSNKRTEFVNRNNAYLVGDDNAFIFMPKAIAFNMDDELVNIDSFPIDFLLYERTENALTEIPAERLASIVTVDTNKGSFDFTEEAIGRTFQLSVFPQIIEEGQDVNELMKSFEFTVTDGYNVYSSKELSLMDNSDRDAWTAWKKANAIPVELEPAALILHTNIVVTTADFPAEFLYDETEVKPGDADYEFAIGSLKDYENILLRYLDKGESFAIEGNYFTLDCSEVPLVIRSNGEIASVNENGEIDEVITSHSCLFRVENAEDIKELENEEFLQAAIRNLYAIGNANRSENVMLSGGLILNKMIRVNMEWNNNIANSWFVTFFSELQHTTLSTIVDCKSYDSYSCHVYVWGSRFSIRNSEFIGSGGPAIIADHVDNNKGVFESQVTIDEASLIEAKVAGTEGWFQQYNAVSVATQLKMLSSSVFGAYGYTFTEKKNEVETFNFIILFKSGKAEGLSFPAITGQLKIGENHTLNYSDPYTKTILSNFVGSPAPIFQSNGHYAFFNGQMLVNPLDMQPVTPDFALFQGKYLNVFVGSDQIGTAGHMAAVFGDLRAVE